MGKLDGIKGKAIVPGELVDYSEDSIVSKTVIDKKAGSLTLFAFDAGQGLSEHTSPYDATVQILDGEAEITVGDSTITAVSGETVIMPAEIPHALRANVPFKMLLIMIR